MSRARVVKVAARKVKRPQVIGQGSRRASQAQLQSADLSDASLDFSRTTYLTVPEAVQYLRFGSRGALYQWVLRRRIPKCRRGRTVLFLRRDLDEAVQPEDRKPALRQWRGAHAKGA